MFYVALRKESVDRNHHSLNLPSSPIESLSARRAWIEISAVLELILLTDQVALRKESVDRNFSALSDSLPALVALRKESVDRNYAQYRHLAKHPQVALRKESVDRNRSLLLSGSSPLSSLSARRAWIEI